jgi:tetratricopeptide (TPR) repeat protein
MRGRGLLGLALLSLAAAGCASVRQAVDSMRSSLVSSLAPKEEGSTAQEVAAAYRAQAEQRERSGELRQAVEAWMTALALTPNHEPSRAALKRVRGRIDREMAEHLEQGWHAVARDAPAEARQHFLAALALDPYSRPAHDALRAVAAGAGADGKPASLTVRPVALTPPPGRAGGVGPEANGGTVRVIPAPEPRRGPGPEAEKPEALYGGAKAHLAEGRDEDAYRALSQLARLSPGYADSAQLLRDLRPRLVRQRYRDGLRLFREELLEEAIEKWRGVLELDARHANARRNIEQAEKMLRTLAAQQKR